MLAEAYGTFVLTLIGPMSITIASNPRIFPPAQYLGLGFIGLAHGVALLIAIASVSHISGGHFNPAITISLSYSGKFPKNRVIPYIIAQLIGAAIAGFVQLAIVGINIAKTTDLGNTFPNQSLPLPLSSALIAEIIGTMILAITVHGAIGNNSRFGSISIGLSLASVIWALGGVSGASLNPARTFGPSIASLIFDPNVFNTFWIYLAGPLLGAILAAELYSRMATGD